MDQSKICGIAIGVLGGWLLWQVWQTVAFQTASGLSVSEVVLEPEFMMRLLAAIAAFVAGIAALTELRGGAWFAGIATFIMGILTFVMIAMGADKSLWQDEITYLFIMTALFLGIMVARSRNALLATEPVAPTGDVE
ncbi:MAG: hypothetical protein AAGK23_03525 [Pseudomonadota bacterium]